MLFFLNLNHSVEMILMLFLLMVNMEMVTRMYLGVWIDNRLSFNIHVKNLKAKIGFFFLEISPASPSVPRKLVEATFLSVIDYSDIMYMHVPLSALQILDSAYHTSLCLFTKQSLLNCHPTSPTFCISGLLVINYERPLVSFIHISQQI